MLLAIVMVSRFLSVSIHTLNISASWSGFPSPRAATNYIISIRYQLIFFANANNNEVCNGQRDMIYQPNLRTYLHTQHLIYNCNISIYFYGVTSSWRLTRQRYPRLLLSSTSGCPWTTWYGAATGAACPRNSHGVAHKRSLPQSIAPIPDLRSNLSVTAPGFTGIHTLPHKESISCLGGRLSLRVVFPWTDIAVF